MASAVTVAAVTVAAVTVAAVTVAAVTVAAVTVTLAAVTLAAVTLAAVTLAAVAVMAVIIAVVVAVERVVMPRTERAAADAKRFALRQQFAVLGIQLLQANSRHIAPLLFLLDSWHHGLVDTGASTLPKGSAVITGSSFPPLQNSELGYDRIGRTSS